MLTCASCRRSFNMPTMWAASCGVSGHVNRMLTTCAVLFVPPSAGQGWTMSHTPAALQRRRIRRAARVLGLRHRDPPHVFTACHAFHGAAGPAWWPQRQRRRRRKRAAHAHQPIAVGLHSECTGASTVPWCRAVFVHASLHASHAGSPILHPLEVRACVACVRACARACVGGGGGGRPTNCRVTQSCVRN